MSTESTDAGFSPTLLKIKVPSGTFGQKKGTECFGTPKGTQFQYLKVPVGTLSQYGGTQTNKVPVSTFKGTS